MRHCECSSYGQYGRVTRMPAPELPARADEGRSRATALGPGGWPARVFLTAQGKNGPPRVRTRRDVTCAPFVSSDLALPARAPAATSTPRPSSEAPSSRARDEEQGRASRPWARGVAKEARGLQEKFPRLKILRSPPEARSKICREALSTVPSADVGRPYEDYRS